MIKLLYLYNCKYLVYNISTSFVSFVAMSMSLQLIVNSAILKRCSRP